MSDTVHRIVTERMMAALERGTVPWHKPWQAAAGRPRSMRTGQPYRGVNVFLLALTAAEEGYDSPFWGTYRQIGDLGGQVRKSERSTLVVFWKQAQIEHRDPHTGEPSIKQLPVLRYYWVFNAAQADHLPERFHPAPGADTEIAEPQAVLNRYLAAGPTLVHAAGDRADYHPATDTIRLPPRAQFHTAEGYYTTAFHEAGHSTGHPARLNRPGIAAFDHFGSHQYAREELAAQMTSAILCAQTGIDNPETFDNSASYIAGWLTALNNDNRLVITAAAQAQRACDLINQAEREPAKASEPHPEAAPTAAGHVSAQTTAAATCPHQAKHGPDEPAVPGYHRGDPAGPPREPAAAPEPQAMAVAAGPACGAADAITHCHGEGRDVATGPQLRAGEAASSPKPTHATTPADDWQAEAG